MTHTRKVSISAIVVTSDYGGLDATLVALERQVYAVDDVVVVGNRADVAATPHGSSVSVAGTLAEAVDALGRRVEFLWILTEGAIPKPDALGAAISDAERTDAGIIGSKLVTPEGALVSVGLITDVFGVPYTGIDESELDQGQYDVVRDVAAVPGSTLLIRRDLLSGLGGVDVLLARRAASIDLAQRARLKGARVIVSPASEVIFDTEAHLEPRWREEAGRIRGVIKAYGFLTLLWVLPLDLLTGLLEVIVSAFFRRWRGSDYVKSWAWNILHLAGTLTGRHRARVDRVFGDEELFRYQRRGSVKISRLWSSFMGALRTRLPKDDRYSVESIGEEVRQPAFVVGLLALVFVLISARNLWSGGLPAVGYSLPFPASGSDILDAYAGGWNPAGFGSTEPLRPLLAVVGVVKLVTFNAATLSEYLLGAGAMLSGIWGVTRLLRTWSIPAVPGLIAGVVFVAGPVAQAIAGNTHLGTLLALGVLPWALQIALKPVLGGVWGYLSRLASVIIVYGLLGALSPLLLVVPSVALLLYSILRLRVPAVWRALALSLIGTSGGVLLLSPWIWNADLAAVVGGGYAYWNLPLVAAVSGCVISIAAVVGGRELLGPVAGLGALLTGLGFLGARSGSFGTGAEFESASLAVLSLGVAIGVGVVASSVSSPDGSGWRRFVMGVGTVGVIFLVAASSSIMLGGRIGLPGDRFESALDFTLAYEGQADTSRVLLLGPPELLPGDSRMIDGGAYRVVSAPMPDLGEARLGEPLELDEMLEGILSSVISGETKRVGSDLAPLGIRWIVVMGESGSSDISKTSVAWRNVFAGQLDLLPLTASVENTVWVTDVSTVGRAVTSSGELWARSGWRYEGGIEPGRRLLVAENPDNGWGPGSWEAVGSMNEVSAGDGVAFYTPDDERRNQGVLVLVTVMLLIGMAMWGSGRP